MTPLITEAELRGGDFDTLIVAAPDMSGRLLGRRMAPSLLDRVADQGVGISTCVFAWDITQESSFTTGLANPETGWRDVVLRPDMATLRRAGWLERTAIVIADICDPATGELVPIAPRTIARRQQELLSRHRRRAWVATELEFYLFRENYDALRQNGYHVMTPTTLTRADYTIQQTDGWEHFFQPLRRALDDSGLQLEMSQGEWGLGQWEINLTYGDPVDVADRHALFKLAVRDVAARAGLSATFMAKPVVDQVGSSCHIHLSMRDQDGAALFFDPAGDHAMSLALRHAVGGILATAPGLMLFHAPTVNAYRRTTSQGFAGHGATWAFDNRTVSCRVLGEDADSLRIEWRVPGADVNPYLAIAGLLAAADHGIEEQIDPGEMSEGNAYDTAVPAFPTDLLAAADAMSADPFARSAFGSDVISQYTVAARAEAAAFAGAVTDWEKARYFEFI